MKPLLLLAFGSLLTSPLSAKDLWPWPMPHGNALSVVFPNIDTIRIAAVYLEGSLYLALTMTDPRGIATPVAMQVDTASNTCLLKKEWAEHFVAMVHDGSFRDGTVGQPQGETADLVTISGASVGPVEIRPFVLITNSLLGLRPQVEIEGQTLPVVGVLGSNVVLRRSLHLNLTQNLFEWSRNNPRAAASFRFLSLAYEQMGMGPVYLVEPGQGEEGGAILDTGAYSSLEPLARAQSLAASWGQRWIVKDSSGGPAYYGLREPRTLLGRTVRQRWGVGLSGVGQPTWGTQILSLFDLWFDMEDEDNPRLWFANVVPEPLPLDPATRSMPPEFSSLVTEMSDSN